MMVLIVPRIAATFAFLVCVIAAQDDDQDTLTGPDRVAVRKVLTQKDSVLKSTFGSGRIESKVAKMSDGDVVIACHRTANFIMLFRIDPQGKLKWDEAVASVRTEGHTDFLTVTPGPQGSCFVSWLQSAPDGLFIRKIDADGGVAWTKRAGEKPFSSYEVIVSRSGELFLLTADNKSVRVHHLRGDGEAAWTKSWPTGSTGPSGLRGPTSSILLNDGRDLFMVWYRFAEGGNVYVAQRLRRSDGVPLWPKPVVLGEAPDFGFVATLKVRIEETSDGLVEAELLKGRINDVNTKTEPYRVRIGPDGSISRK